MTPEVANNILIFLDRVPTQSRKERFALAEAEQVLSNYLKENPVAEVPPVSKDETEAEEAA